MLCVLVSADGRSLLLIDTEIQKPESEAWSGDAETVSGWQSISDNASLASHISASRRTSVYAHYAAPEAEIEKYLAASHVTAVDVVTHDRRRRSRQFPVGAVSVWRLRVERANILQMAPQSRFTYSSTATSGAARLINQTTKSTAVAAAWRIDTSSMAVVRACVCSFVDDPPTIFVGWKWAREKTKHGARYWTK